MEVRGEVTKWRMMIGLTCKTDGHDENKRKETMWGAARDGDRLHITSVRNCFPLSGVSSIEDHLT